MYMCIDCDIILANLLLYSKKAYYGISFNDIEDYCNKLQVALLENDKIKLKSISFQIYSQDVDFCLRKYPMYFNWFSGRFYKGYHLVDLKKFYNVSNILLKDIMKLIAQKM